MTDAAPFAQLIALGGDRQLWSDRYEEDSNDVFDILDHCTPRMAMSVRRRVAADDLTLAADRPLDERSFEELLSLANPREVGHEKRSVSILLQDSGACGSCRIGWL